MTAQGSDHVRACHFLDASDELVIVCDTFKEVATTRVDQRLVRLDVPSGAVAATLRLPRAYRTILPPAANGCMAMAGVNEREDRTDIVDHRSGSVECSIVARKADSRVQRNPAASEIWPAALSPSGNTVLTTAGGLQRLDGRPVWTPDPKIETVATQADGKTFIVTERWKAVLKSVRLPYDWTTYAVRDLEDGRVLYRTWQRPEHKHWSSDGRLGVGDDLAIFLLPPPINWPILTICHVILGLPLAITWSIRRWTRQRRLRRIRAPLPAC